MVYILRGWIVKSSYSRSANFQISKQVFLTRQKIQISSCTTVYIIAIIILFFISDLSTINIHQGALKMQKKIDFSIYENEHHG